ncbi:MAG: Sodium/glucose cotransporter, partial [Bacteroidota bacterium]
GSHLMMQFVFFSAGVGPVYVLRWTWWRINAWTQLAAMIGALFIGFFWLDIMNILSPGLDTKNSLWWNIVVPGALNCCIWISVLFITRNSSKQWSSLKKIARAGVLRSLYCFRCWWYFIALSCASLLLLFWSGIPILFSRFYHFLLD